MLNELLPRSSGSFVSPLYESRQLDKTYPTEAPCDPHPRSLAGHILPSGEQIERGRKKKARAEAGRRALQAPDLVDFPGIGSQASRKADCQLTRAGWYGPIRILDYYQIRDVGERSSERCRDALTMGCGQGVSAIPWIATQRLYRCAACTSLQNASYVRKEE